MNSMNKQVQENTIQSQNEWNACLLFRNKQLTKEVKELRSVLICFTGVASWQTWESVSLPLRN